MNRLLHLSTAALIVATGALLASHPAAAQGTCDWYGRTAVKQQQENEQKKCGFTGPDWTSDLKAHISWCASVAPDAWKKAAQRRDQDLAACGKKTR